MKVKAEGKKKKNRNGKVGINKHNNFTPDKYAPRKTCVNCGSVNHLTTYCKSVKNANVHLPKHVMNVPMFIMSAMPNLFDQNVHQYTNMPFVPNPYFNAFSMPQMPWNIPSMNNMYANIAPMHASNLYASEHLTNPILQRSTPKVKVDLNQSKPKVQNDMVNRKKANKIGPKETWVPKST
ncbi:hypothetical protein POM88_008018 [Heracleum sosnowskyi]|uniref:Uncharacterized protein n=1 Tax=Heracleum sosnowskyi TaxID=360622 RepID=A0AAD8J949_9APIA|nr:hypothetical protein POM88_008018 [Heracleum sosnowskyi]